MAPGLERGSEVDAPRMGGGARQGRKPGVNRRDGGRRAARPQPHDSRADLQAEANRKSAGKTVVVQINDRGPRGKGQVIDVSRKAAEELDFAKEGKTRVKLEVVSDAAPRPARLSMQIFTS